MANTDESRIPYTCSPAYDRRKCGGCLCSTCYEQEFCDRCKDCSDRSNQKERCNAYEGAYNY
ncbi:MAG: hypothetical protein Q4D55_02875 [Eubacteriales bacterium]|nr:hypothetical protein [Eubacteriales bacterium]